TMGAYHVTIDVLARGGTIPPPASQTVILDFAGGTDTHYFGHPIQIAPFSAGRYNDALEGQDDVAKRAIADTVSLIWRAYNLEIRTSDDPPPAGPASRVYITTPGFFQVGDVSFAGG